MENAQTLRINAPGVVEIESTCGCRIAGEFKNAIYKQAVGDPVFTSCEKHKPLEDDFKVLMREVLDKEAKDAQAAPPLPPPAPEGFSRAPLRVWRRWPEMLVQRRKKERPATEPATEPAAAAPAAASNATAGPPIRSLRTSGSNGTSGNRPAAPAPAARSHRPVPRPSGGGSGARRVPPRRHRREQAEPAGPGGDRQIGQRRSSQHHPDGHWHRGTRGPARYAPRGSNDPTSGY